MKKLLIILIAISMLSCVTYSVQHVKPIENETLVVLNGKDTIQTTVRLRYWFDQGEGNYKIKIKDSIIVNAYRKNK